MSHNRRKTFHFDPDLLNDAEATKMILWALRGRLELRWCIVCGAPVAYPLTDAAYAWLNRLLPIDDEV